MTTLIQDLRYALRSLSKSPGFTAIAVATLALGIGANTAIFSVVHSVLWKPLPFASPQRLAVIWETDIHNGELDGGASWPDYRDWKAQAGAFSSLAAAKRLHLNLTEGGQQPERVAASAVSHELFPLLGARPALGRAFSEADDRPGAPGAVVLSDALWRGRFAASPEVLGRPISLDGKACIVVGVMAPRFEFPQQTQAWVALEPNLAPFGDVRGVHNLTVFGRLAKGASLETAGAQMGSIALRLARQYPDDNAGRGTRVQDLREAEVGDVRPALLVLLGAVALVTLIACANVSGLLLARAATRSREVAIRRALGAGRGRLLRQLLTESLLLAILGGASGLALAAWGTDVLLALAPRALPRTAEVGLHLPVLAFSLGVSIAAGILAGLAPALGATRSVALALREEDSRTASRSRGRAALVVAQVALACVLATGAGLLLKSLHNLLRVDPGFRVSGLLTAELTLPDSRYPMPSGKDWYRWPEVLRFYDAILPRLQALPGASSAALAINHPLRPGWTSQIEVEGRPQQPGARDEVRIRAITPDYFRTIDTPILRGRALNTGDRQDTAPVLVINEALARKYFPDVDPVGQKISFWGQSREVVGVVRDVRFRGLASGADPAVYPSLLQTPISSLAVVIRAQGDPASLIPALREAVRSADPDVALYNIKTADTLLTESLGAPRFQTTLLSAFGAAALLLAALGLYGLLAYAVTRRTREIGIRAALGARRADLVRMILREGFGRCLLGLVFGVAASFAAARLLSGMLYGVGAADPMVIAGVVGVLLVVALLASYLPARRAANVDPMTALRAD